MQRFTRRVVFVHLLATFVVAAEARPQGGLGRAVLALARPPDGPVRQVSGRLFGGLIEARILDRNGNPSDFADADEIEFTIRGGNGRVLPFTSPDRTRAGFEEWAQGNAETLLDIIFPSSLSAATLGLDAPHIYAQQLLLSTALSLDGGRESGAPRRSTAGGLVEFEWHTNADDSTRAWQGLYQIGRFLSVQGRYTRQRQDIATSSWAVAVDYHPYLEIEGPAVVRVGATARTGFLYSRFTSLRTPSSDPIPLGTIDPGAGGWVSALKRFNRVRVGGGALFQGTKSHAPFGGEDGLGFLAEVINSRPIAWDVAYGGTFAADTTPSTAVIVKYLESRSVNLTLDRTTRLALIGYSFTLGPGSALDAGYKITRASGQQWNSLFLQGNFGW